VELITATALMTVMMLGVVQIFAIVTQAAGDAQAMEFAIQQQRALFDTLYNDFNGLTREGYLRIAKGYFDVTTAVGTNAPLAAFPTIIPTLATYRSGTMKPANTIPPPLPITIAGAALANCESWYGCDTLQFVSIGQFRSVSPNPPWNNASGGANATASGAAEVMYTNNVLTPTNFLYVQPGGSEPNVYVDNRKGVLMRAAWLPEHPTMTMTRPWRLGFRSCRPRPRRAPTPRFSRHPGIASSRSPRSSSELPPGRCRSG
jgi:hypothetical protein